MPSPTIHFLVLDKSPLRPWKGSPSCNNRQLWWDPLLRLDSLTTGELRDQLTHPQTRPSSCYQSSLSPASPLMQMTGQECPDQVTNKRDFVDLFPFPLFLFNPFYPTSFLLSWYWTQKSDWASAWAEGRRLITSGGQRTPMILTWFLVGPSSHPSFL